MKFLLGTLVAALVVVVMAGIKKPMGEAAKNDNGSHSLHMFADGDASTPAVPIPAAIPMPIPADTGAVRKFEITLDTIRPGGMAIATGCFYDIPPEVTTSPEKLPPAKRNWTQAHTFFVTGIPPGLIDGQECTVWLRPDGTKTYTDVRGGYHTVAAYKVASAPPAVEYKSAPGAWMHEGGSALDKRPMTPIYQSSR